MEFYYSLNGDIDTSFAVDSINILDLYIGLIILAGGENDTVINKTYLISKKLGQNQFKNNLYQFIGTKRYLLMKGEYKLQVNLRDSDFRVIQPEVKRDVKIIPFINKNSTISHIQLAANIIEGSSENSSVFYKNTYKVIPNVIGIYTSDHPLLYYYSELYNISSRISRDTLFLEEKIFDNINRVLFDRSNKIFVNENSIVKVGRFDISSFSSGSYTLEIRLCNMNGSVRDVSYKKFYYYNPSIEKINTAYVESDSYLQSEFGILSIEECDEQFDWVKYIASSDEIDQFSKLDLLITKRKFLYNFWKKRDPVPATNENEFKNDYLKRVKFCNTWFKQNNQPGYKTDRGRIYLTYGEWNQLEENINQIDKKPYVIWFYNNLEGGVMFVFADLNGYGNFELVHSTMRGEIKNSNWIDRISIN